VEEDTAGQHHGEANQHLLTEVVLVGKDAFRSPTFDKLGQTGISQFLDKVMFINMI
jgi:hypothetical protein